MSDEGVIAKAIRLSENHRRDNLCDNPEAHGCGRAKACERCGYAADSFACKVRHIAIDTSWAKNDH